MPLSFQFPSFNKGDNAVPNTAVTGLRGNENSSALIHNVYANKKIVFMPALLQRDQHDRRRIRTTRRACSAGF